MKGAYALAGLALMIALGAAAFVALKPSVSSEPLGASPGGSFFFPLQTFDTVINSGLYATSSQGSSITITATELNNWLKVATVSYAPGLLAGQTLTFPASSTIPSFLPKAGDRARVCLLNGTTTASVPVTLAGGTGFSLNVASSSVSALGSTIIRTGETGCIDFVRRAATATAFDIDANLVVFQ